MSRRGRIRCLSTVVLTMVLIALTGAAMQFSANADTESNRPASMPSDIAPARRPQVKVAGWIREVEAAHWLLGDRIIYLDPASPPAGSAEVGAYAVVKGTVDGQDRLWADAVSVLPGVEWGGESLSPDLLQLIAQSPNGPTGYRVEFRGLVQEIQPRYWVVGNRLVFVTDRTAIQGWPQIDALAEVKGTLLYGDIVLAQSIKVTLPGAFAEVEFEGIIESLSPDTWIVNGASVTISPVTVIEGTPALGMVAEVRGVLQPDGSVLAQHISVKSPGFTPQVDVEGLVEHIASTHWVVAGRTVSIDNNTFIDESRAPAEVGMWAQVRALYQRDGSLLALRIRLSRPSYGVLRESLNSNGSSHTMIQ